MSGFLTSTGKFAGLRGKMCKLLETAKRAVEIAIEESAFIGERVEVL